MNVFRSFTRRSLMENRSRTLVTIIGIILSMSLFTAVIEGAYSGVQYLIRAEEARNGRYHGFYYELTSEELIEAQRQDGISESSVWQTVGWAEIGSENESKPYLLIKSIDDHFTDLVSINLVSGRMPENEGEILIPDHLAVNGNVRLSLEDTLNLAVGQRVSDGYVMGEHNPYTPGEPEVIANAVLKNYTVVGFYSRLVFDIEDYSCPGYTALTVGEAGGEYGCFFRLDKPGKFYDFMEQNGIQGKWRAHRDLLIFSGSLRDSGLVQVLYGFVAVLVFLISFGSISLIYNSFSISISDRTRQFGILKSVGATRRQIRSTVLYEAAILSLAAIPIGLIVGCAGIGITLWCLRDSFAFLLDGDLDIQMRLVISPAGLIAAVLCCLITTLASAWIPARRAIKLSAIDAIRQSKDVKLRKRDVRVSWLTKKLFGFEGMLAAKNFGRNRRQYRATIISLFLSVVLFISASSFCSYLTSAVTDVSSIGGADIIYSLGQQDDAQPDEAMAALRVEGVQDAAYIYQGYAMLNLERTALTGPFLDYTDTMRGQLTQEPEVWTAITFVDDDNFRELCNDNGLDPAPFFDRSNPMAIALNSTTDSYMQPGTNRLRWITLEILDAAALPAVGYQKRETQIDGYWFYGQRADVSGNYKYWYYPDEAYDAYIQSDQLPPDETAIVLNEAEAILNIPFAIGAAIVDREFYLPDEMRFAIVYPCSMKDVVGSADFREELSPQVLFDAPAHGEVYDRMHRVLVENGWRTSSLYDLAESYESEQMLITIINVFSFGFIILISLIAIANVFNTISTSIGLRRREFAMLRSVGLTGKGFDRMMNYECMIYGVHALLWGLPAAFAMSYVIYRITDVSFEVNFHVPLYSIAIAVGSVFVVVFCTMLYATHRLRRDNTIDALKNENL